VKPKAAGSSSWRTVSLKCSGQARNTSVIGCSIQRTLYKPDVIPQPTPCLGINWDSYPATSPQRARKPHCAHLSPSPNPTPVGKPPKQPYLPLQCFIIWSSSNGRIAEKQWNYSIVLLAAFPGKCNGFCSLLLEHQI
jgi:hypothetical protein